VGVKSLAVRILTPPPRALVRFFYFSLIFSFLAGETGDLCVGALLGVAAK
jgi:hypothetical protein